MSTVFDRILTLPERHHGHILRVDGSEMDHKTLLTETLTFLLSLREKRIGYRDRILLTHPHPDTILPLVLALWSRGSIPIIITTERPIAILDSTINATIPHCLITRGRTRLMHYDPRYLGFDRYAESSLKTQKTTIQQHDIKTQDPHNSALIFVNYDEEGLPQQSLYTHERILRSILALREDLMPYTGLRLVSDHLFFSLAAYMNGASVHSILHQVTPKTLNAVIDHHRIRHAALSLPHALHLTHHENLQHLSIGPQAPHAKEIQKLKDKHKTSFDCYYGNQFGFPLAHNKKPEDIKSYGKNLGKLYNDIVPIHRRTPLQFAQHPLNSSLINHPVVFKEACHITKTNNLILEGTVKNHQQEIAYNAISQWPSIEKFIILPYKGQKILIFTTKNKQMPDKNMLKIYHRQARKWLIDTVIFVSRMPTLKGDPYYVDSEKVTKMLQKERNTF